MAVASVGYRGRQLTLGSGPIQPPRWGLRAPPQRLDVPSRLALDSPSPRQDV